jgi:hypothetical protein
VPKINVQGGFKPKIVMGSDGKIWPFRYFGEYSDVQESEIDPDVSVFPYAKSRVGKS